MAPGVSREALQLPRQIDEHADLVLVAVARGERVLAERALERHAELEGDELGQLIDEAVRMAEHAADVAHHGLGRHGAEGDDLRDALAPARGFAVTLDHVLDHPVAAVHAEIDVEIGQ